MDIDKLIADGILRPFAGGSLSRTDLSRPLVVLNPRKIAIEADTSEQVRLVIVHTEPNEAAIDLSLAAGVQVTLTEICLAGTFTEVRIRQAEQSSCRIVAVQLHGANTAYRIDLAEHGAENRLGTLRCKPIDKPPRCAMHEPRIGQRYRDRSCDRRVQGIGICCTRCTTDGCATAKPQHRVG